MIAAIEAAAVALAVFAAIAVPSVLLWWLSFGLGAEPSVVAGVAAQLWQLAHFVPMRISISAQAALGLGLAPEALSFALSLAPLGLTLVTVLLGFRSGRRFAASGGAGAWSLFGGAVGFGVAAGFAAMLAGPSDDLQPWARIAVPVAVYTVPLALGFALRAAAEGQEWWFSLVRSLQRSVEGAAPVAAAALPERAAETLRLAAAALAGLLALGAFGVSIAILVGYVDIAGLGQSLQLDVFGALMLFLLQLVLLPVAWIWAISWFVGSGFSVGLATSVTPFETLLGPLPALPLFGAIPDGWGWAGGLAPAIVVALGATVGGIFAGRPAMRRAPTAVAVLVPVCAALLVGLLAMVLGALASGAIGPGRLSAAGPVAWKFGALAAAELAFGMCLGVFARRVDTARLRDLVPAGLLAEAGAGAAASGRDTEPVGRDADLIETVPVEPLAGPASTGAASAGSAPVGAEPAAAPVDPLLADQPTIEVEPLADEPALGAEHELADSAPVEFIPKASGSRSAPAPADPQPTRSELAAPEPTETGPVQPEPEEAVDPLLEAFSWEAKPEGDGAPARRDSGWRGRLRSRPRRD